MDSLPSDGAWDCLSPAQREAILALHRSRTAFIDESIEHADGHGGTGRPSALRKPTRTQGLSRFGRSRSYDDRLESETDDSGVRGVNGTNSSGAASHEDDSSDPGVKRGGRFTKAVSADRATRRDVKNEIHELNNMKNIRKTDIVTNGFGNVNKIISKQMNKSSVMSNGTSNITLDCRNVQGEKRRRSRIDVDGPFRDCSLERNLESIRENESSRRTPASDSQQNRIGLGRRTILTDNFESETKLHSLKEVKETVSSEEYDSGVNFKNDDSVDEYIRNRQKSGCEFSNDIESDRTPRSDSTSPTLPTKRERSNDHLRSKGDDLTSRKPSAEKDPFGGWDHTTTEKIEKTRPREREGRSIMSHSLDKHYQERSSSKSTKPSGEPLKSNLKVGYGAKLNSTFDYRTNLNQDQLNKYSSNWNNMILNRDVPIKPSSNNVSSSQAVVSGRESRFAKNTSSGVLTRSTGNLANRSAMAAHRKGDSSNWALTDPRRTPNPSHDRSSGKKYIRSKSLDRKYLDDDSSDEDSDFETRRRTERTRRYHRANQDWEVGHLRAEDRGRHRSREMLESRYNYNNSQPMKPKAKSAWDLSAQSKKVQDDFDDFEDIGFRTRSDFRNRWLSEDSDVTRRKKVSDSSGEFSRLQWNRRSCDFDLDLPSEEKERKLSDKSVEFDRKRWYRRSCDLDLDFEYHNRQRREVEFDVDWGRQALEHYDDFETEPVHTKGKSRRTRIAEQQLLQIQEPGRNKSRYEDPLRSDMRRGEDEDGRKTRMDNDNGRRTRMDDYGERRLRIDDFQGRHVRMDDDSGRRTRLEEHYRSKTSMGYHGKEKRERSRTPHLLRGKLRILKSILSF